MSDILKAPRCYGGVLVVDVVQELAQELNIPYEVLPVNSFCDKAARACFARGMDKFDILWQLVDRTRV